MLIAGFEKNTLLDYPGKVASIIFTYGCNLKCRYCHNPELVVDKCNYNSLIPEDLVIEYLDQRQGLIDGLVVTGGEPTLQTDLISFLRRIKKLGLLIKLDTNGIDSKVVKKILRKGLVDYWAMDIKYPSEYYNDYNINVDHVRKSIELIMNSGKDYEFRTTYVKGIHKMEDIEGIGELIKGSKKYFIQNFRKGKSIDKKLNSKNSFKEDELKQIKEIISKYSEIVEIR